MADFRLLYHAKVIADDVLRLDRPTRVHIQRAIESKLLGQPEQFAEPLAYTRAGSCSLRVGHWRVVFALRAKEIWVLRIGHRREVYQDLGGRLPPERG